jgi:hypothetical protein
MGDRALIVFTDKSKEDCSPVIYLHSDGYKVGDWIAELKTLMQGREGDVSYAAARFVGICHSHIPGNTSLGMWDGGEDVIKDPKGSGHGDHGVIIVNASDFTFEQFGAYSSCKLEGRAN